MMICTLNINNSVLTNSVFDTAEIGVTSPVYRNFDDHYVAEGLPLGVTSVLPPNEYSVDQRRALVEAMVYQQESGVQEPW